MTDLENRFIVMTTTVDTKWQTTTGLISSRWKTAWTTVMADAKKLWALLLKDFGVFIGEIEEMINKLIANLGRIIKKLEDLEGQANATAGAIWSLINALRTLAKEPGYDEMAIVTGGTVTIVSGRGTVGVVTPPPPDPTVPAPPDDDEPSVTPPYRGGEASVTPNSSRGGGDSNRWYNLTIVNPPIGSDGIFREYFVMEGMGA